VKPFENISLSDYTYELPDDRIAAFPMENREESLLLVSGKEGNIFHDHFRNLADYLEKGDQLVFNNSRVIPARLLFTKNTGSKIEIFCLAPADPPQYDLSLGAKGGCTWECMIGNLKRFTGRNLTLDLMVSGFPVRLNAEKLKQNGNLAWIRFTWNHPDGVSPDHPVGVSFAEILSCIGKTPLPPYIKREPDENDRERYQTIYSKKDGSVAAPTAGLHFTEQVFTRLRDKGIAFHEVTLHVGAGTFQPIKGDSLEEHIMHAEFIQVSRDFIHTMSELDQPVVAVGTTSVRTLESLYWMGVKLLQQGTPDPDGLRLDQWESYGFRQDVSIRDAFQELDKWLVRQEMNYFFSSTRLMIVPGYRFRTVKTLITNFHQPGSTLLLLVAAFIGSSWKEAYRYALGKGFRFLSYGDSSILFSRQNG
jgi:S-adenosylmethionine:tRNA ribosyltransferase-isomerase